MNLITIVKVIYSIIVLLITIIFWLSVMNNRRLAILDFNFNQEEYLKKLESDFLEIGYSIESITDIENSNNGKTIEQKINNLRVEQKIIGVPIFQALTFHNHIEKISKNIDEYDKELNNELYEIKKNLNKLENKFYNPHNKMIRGKSKRIKKKLNKLLEN